MKLFLLKAIPPFDPSYDATHGLLIRAESDQHAREMANEATAFDYKKLVGKTENGRGIFEPYDHPWLDPERTSCDEVAAEGEPGVLLCDYLAG